jgi:hypothetical protein
VCSFQTKFSPFFSPSLFSIRNLKKKKKTKKKPVLLHKPSSETLAQNTAATQNNLHTYYFAEILEFSKQKN